MLGRMDEVATETGATLAQIAIAWILQRPGITAPIASATSLGQLNELIGATKLKLSPTQMAALA